MLQFLNTNMDFFGLDISETSLKAASLKKSGREIGFLERVSIDTDIIKRGRVWNEDSLTLAIKEITKKIKPKSKYVAISLPEEKSFFQMVEMPKMNLKQLREAIEYEAEDYIPLPAEEMYIDFQIVSSEEDHLDVLVVALPGKIVDPYVSATVKAGLFPVVAEVESIATARAVVPQKEENPLLLIDIGESKTSLIVFSKGLVRFTSYISTSSGEFTREISRRGGIDLKEAERIKKEHGIEDTDDVYKALSPVLDEMADVVKKHLDYYNSCGFIPYGEKIEKIVLCGGGANLKGLTEFLSRKLKVSVEKGSVMSDSGLLDYGAAVGLAIRNFKNGV